MYAPGYGSAVGNATACRSCGSPLCEREMATGVSTLRYCGTRSCALFGLPSMRGGGHTVTLDDSGDLVA